MASWSKGVEGKHGSAAISARPPSKLASVCTLTLSLAILTAAAAAVSDGAQYLLIDQMRNGVLKGDDLALRRAAEAAEIRQQAIISSLLLAHTVAAIAFLFWTYRSHVYAKSVAVPSPMISPAWAIGCFFIPIFNLWMPRVAMSELWRVSVQPHGWGAVIHGPIVNWWWVLLLSAAFVGLIASVLGRSAETLEQLQLATGFGIAHDLVLVIGAGVTIALVRRTTQAQVDASRSMDQDDILGVVMDSMVERVR